MEIAAKNALFVSPLFICGTFLIRFLFSSLPSSEDFNVPYPPPPSAPPPLVCFLNMSLLLHTALDTSDTHLGYHRRRLSIFRTETRELLVLLKSEFQMAVVSTSVALEVGLKQQV